MRRSLVVAAVVAALFAAAGPPASATADPYRSRQWALNKIRAAAAWNVSKGAGVTIAVVDTGIDLTHPDLKGKIVSHYTCIGTCKSGGADDNGHGSHVAGIAAASTGNGVGIAGVAPAAKLMSVKVLDSDGGGDCEDVKRGTRWAADHGARVINLSLGPDVGLIDSLLGGDCAAAIQSGATYASQKGAVVVVAAGNDSLRSVYDSPALIVVGATGPDDEAAYYSSSGANIYAPGGDALVSCGTSTCIFSTWLGGYRLEEGTSMAAPHVSGVAALLLARGYGKAQVLSRLRSTADNVGGLLRVNAARAVGSPASSGSLPRKSSPSARTSAGSQPGGARTTRGRTTAAPAPTALVYGPTATAMPTAAILGVGPSAASRDVPGRSTKRILVGLGALFLAVNLGGFWSFGLRGLRV
jgi:serine protease